MSWVLPRKVGMGLGRRAIQRLFSFFMWYCAITKMGIFDFDELDQLADSEGVIIAPNHPCLVDAVFCISRLPKVGVYLKASLWHNPVLGGAHLAHYIKNDSHSSLIRKSVAELKEGGQLLIFPEGTRTVTQPVNEFKRGFALIAQKAQVPVQTVFIEVKDPPYHKGYPFFKKPNFPVPFRIRLGKRFEISKDEDLRKWVSNLEDYYREELESANAE